MNLVDSRRLTGPNLLSREPLALADVTFEPGEDPAQGAERWGREAALICKEVGLEFDRPLVRHSARLSSFGFHAPIDVLLLATDVNDLAIGGGDRNELALKIKQARNPRLLALQRESRARGLPFLWDDQLISIGHGAGCRSFPLAELPDVGQVPWSECGRVPVALITGTNGKTTSARLLARIAQLAGLRAGLASTDAIAVDGKVQDRGDFTGPFAARAVLRNRLVQFAVLETARGGILRRGLAVEEADAALLTNVSDDHLGEYGIDTVEQLAEAKLVIARAVAPTGRVILNADDALLRQHAGSFKARTSLFSLDADQALLTNFESWALRGDSLVYSSNGREEKLMSAADLPLSFGGAARFNIANALGVLALASALGLPRAAALEGLRTFGPTPADNPGRANLVEVGGVAVLIDFGHNPHGVRAIAPFAAELRRRQGGGRLFVISGAAGDRGDQALSALAAELCAMSPTKVYLRELVDYLRGRQPGEVPRVIQSELVRLGMHDQSVTIAPSEAEALRSALGEAKPGDLIVLLVHLDEKEVAEVLAAGR